MGSRVIGFRVPDDLAEELERASAERGQTTGEFLRKLVDDSLYPDRRVVALDETVSERLDMLEAMYEGLGKHIEDLDERLELGQVGKGLADADKEHYDGALDELTRGLAELTQRIDKLLEQDNKNVRMVNENFKDWGDKVSLLFQTLDRHTHTSLGGATLDSSEANKLIDAEVKLADKRLGELPVKVEEEPKVVQGKVNRKGYKFLEHLNISVKED